MSGRIPAIAAWAAALFFAFPAWTADNLISLLQLGGPRDSINAITTDSNGNVIVAGNTSSFNLPVTNGSTNRGTPVSVSNDFGQTWGPLSTVAVSNLVLDASTPPILYGLGSSDPNVQTNLVMKSIDGGKTWAQTGSFSALSALASDPTQPGVLYAGDTSGIFTSSDGGKTWQGPFASGITNNTGFLYFNYIVVDPFQPDVVYTAIPFNPPYRSSDGGQTWTPYSIPGAPLGLVVFAKLQPGVLYQPTYSGLLQSADFGASWSLLKTPFLHPWVVATDPKTKGVVYVLDQSGSVYRSTDSGVSWIALLTTADASGTLAVEPFGASVLLTDSERSGDAGATWQPLSLGRRAGQILFDPATPGRVLAVAAVGNDAFLAKLDPTGQNVLFATYQGGMTGAGATFVAADSDGNMYITGYAGPDFPVTPGVVGPSPNPYGNSFVAKFDPSGKLLYSTYLPDPRGTALLGLVLDASGNAYVSGFSSYNNPPLNYTCFVDKISPDGTSLLFADDLPAAGCYLTEDPAGDIVAWGQSLANVYPPLTLVIKLDANGNPTWWRTLAADFAYISGLAFDAAGDIYVAGRTTSSTFPVTPGAYQTTISQVSVSCPVDLGGFAPGNTDAFIAKLDPVGASVLAATYLGGDCNNLPQGISVAPDGSVCLLVTTDSGNFPVVAAFSNITSSAGFGTFITQFDANLSNLLLSSPVGASASQSPVLFIDPSGTVYIGGYATFLAAIESQ